MKRKISFVITLLLMLSLLLLALTACGEKETGHSHTSSGAATPDNDEACGEKETGHSHTSSGAATPDNDEVCTICGYVINKAVGIKFNTLTLNGNNVYGKVSSDTEAYSFINEVTAVGGAKYLVSKDISGEYIIANKWITLNAGDNTVYITEYINDEPVEVYKVVIRRIPVYTVTFDTNGGTAVETLTVDEDTILDAPETTYTGYTFTGWDYDFSAPIMSDTHIKASWKANTDTRYTVEYYLENLDKSDYELVDTDELTGTTDTTAKALIKEFEHFTFNSAKSTTRGNLAGDGSLVLKIYYRINTYTLSNSNTDYGTISNAGNYVFGESFDTIAVPKLGYYFLGWYSGDELISTDREYTLYIDRNVIARFDIAEEMKIFKFTSDETTCTITGIKDNSISELTIPDIVTSIGDRAFYNCTNLASVTIGNSVTSIGDYAFSYCTSLTNVTIGNSVTNIGFYAFDKCYKLVEVINKSSLNITKGSSANGYVAYYAKEVHTGDSKVFNKDGYLFYTYGGINYLICYIGDDTDLILPENYNGESYEIYRYAFYDCTSLTSVTIPDSVTSIGNYAFYDCTSLTSVMMGNSVTSIGYYAFRYCTSLTSMTIPDGVTNIDYFAFAGCDSLTSITIPDSVTSIGFYAFYNCTGLANIKYRGTNTQWNAISKGLEWDSNTGSYTITYNYTEE